METINANAAVLSNFEVKSLLQELRAQQKRTNTGSPLATIIYETTRYLQDTPCNTQTPEIINKFLKALEPFKLTKAEKVMLLNNPPTTALEIQLMVEESEERLTDEEVEQLLQIVVDLQLVPPKDDPETMAVGGRSAYAAFGTVQSFCVVKIQDPRELTRRFIKVSAYSVYLECHTAAPSTSENTAPDIMQACRRWRSATCKDTEREVHSSGS